MRIRWLRASRLTLTAAGLCLALSSCGGAASTGPPPAVGLSVTAPTTGAVVGVRTIEVSGTVTPAGSQVKVAGHRVQVSSGKFLSPFRLRRGTTAIRITARAPGYQPAAVQTTVHYSASTAKAVAAGERAATAGSSDTGSPTTVATTLVGGSAIHLTAAGRAEAVDQCAAGDGSRAGCQCTMDAMVRLGVVRTRATVVAFVSEMQRAVEAHNVALIPLAVRLALANCASQDLELPGSSG